MYVCSQTLFSVCSLDVALWLGFGNPEPHRDESRVLYPKADELECGENLIMQVTLKSAV